MIESERDVFSGIVSVGRVVSMVEVVQRNKYPEVHTFICIFLVPHYKSKLRPQ